MGVKVTIKAQIKDTFVLGSFGGENMLKVTTHVELLSSSHHSESNFLRCCHGSSKFGCLGDAISRWLQPQGGVAVWEDESCSSFSLLLPQPSRPPLCSGNKRRGNLRKAAKVALESGAAGWTPKKHQYLLPWNPNICRRHPTLVVSLWTCVSNCSAPSVCMFL